MLYQALRRINIDSRFLDAGAVFELKDQAPGVVERLLRLEWIAPYSSADAQDVGIEGSDDAPKKRGRPRTKID